MIQYESILAAIGVHIICNILGVPDFPRMFSKPLAEATGLMLVTIIGILCWVSGFALLANRGPMCGNVDLAA